MLEAVVDFRQRTEFGHNGVDTVSSVGEARRRLVVEELPHLLAAHGLSEQVRVARRVLPPHYCERDDVDPEKQRGYGVSETTANLPPLKQKAGGKWWSGVVWKH